MFYKKYYKTIKMFYKFSIDTYAEVLSNKNNKNTGNKIIIMGI